MTENKPEDSKQYYPNCFCLLPTRGWAAFCGLSLFFIGILWLLDEVGILDHFWWNLTGPVLLIIWGGAYIWHYLQTKH